MKALVLTTLLKCHYTWIYKTVLRDESRIAAVVAGHHLQIKSMTQNR